MFPSNNTSNKADNTNTNIKMLFGSTASLSVNYWSDKISLKINPLQTVSSDGLRQYDYNRRIQTALSVDSTTTLANGIEKYILPRLNSNNPDNGKDISISIRGPKILTTIGYKKDNGIDKTYLTMTPITSDGNYDSANSYTYEFNTQQILIDVEKGSNIAETVHSEFMFIYKKFRDFHTVFGDASHSINVDTSYKNSRSSNYSNFSNQQTVTNDYSAPVSSFAGIEGADY